MTMTSQVPDVVGKFPVNNPLVNFTDLPLFDQIKPEHVEPAIRYLLTQAREAVQHAESLTEPDWQKFVLPLEDATERLSRAWGAISHLNSVADTPELRAVYNTMQIEVTEFWTSVGQNLNLFKQYQWMRQHADFASLPRARQTIIEHALRDFKLGGAELSDEKKIRYAQIQERLATLTTRYSENILDATNHFALHIDDVAELDGLPQDVLEFAQATAKEAGKSGYQFNLHFPSYFPVLQYANNRKLREAMYRAYVTKASELGEKAEWDNSALMVEILKLRQEEAHLLGYANFAEVSLQSKMAQSPAQVVDFLRDLAKRARPYAENDKLELIEFARTHLQLDQVESWDLTWVSEKLREQRYAFSENEVKQYFQQPKVMQGLFELAESLFGVQISKISAPVWHADVEFYKIERQGKTIARFYLDLYARNGKRGGAWMDDARGRKRIADSIQTPVAYLVCNFTAPLTKDGVTQPALLTHDEVITLFHEFGHGLHHMLTEVEDLSVSGINGVEWDAVELPSQFMENFCWEWDVLQSMSAHVETGAALPRTLFDKMLAAKNFQAGLQTLRQVEFAMFDLTIHTRVDGLDDAEKIQQALNQVRHEIAVIQPPEFNRFQHAFSHIFAGGYAAGYYSYKWAEVLSADAYAAFEEAQASKDSRAAWQATGQHFMNEILAQGGARPALESFRAFRGRDPSITALLRHNGMTEETLSP